MCYSVILEEEIQKLVKRFGADVDYNLIHQLAHERTIERIEKKDFPRRISFSKAFEANFREPRSEIEALIQAEFDQYRVEEMMSNNRDLAKQRKRLETAEEKLSIKETKTQLEERRKAIGQIAKYERWIADQKRGELKERDSQIYPKDYGLVIVMEAGRMVIKPMRYHCRPFGFPESVDKEFEGCYNARRDSIEKGQAYWRNIFGRNHGFVVAYSFYEHVPTWRLERRPEPSDRREADKSTEIRFNPKTGKPMFFACLWDRWTSPDQPDLLSFAIITDEPPPEVSAAGHDRCPIPLKEENLERWLTPQGRTKEELFEILDERERPYYEHQLAKAA